MQDAKPTSQKLAYWAGFLYFFLGFAYLIYSAVTGTGLFGVITNWEESHFGASSTMSAFLPEAALFMLSFLVIQRLVPRNCGIGQALEAGIDDSLASPRAGRWARR